MKRHLLAATMSALLIPVASAANLAQSIYGLHHPSLVG